jgi:UPF0716 protein FxsA
MIRTALLVWVLLEVAAFALAGQLVGVLGTLALVLLTAVAGGLLLRAQGAEALAALRGGIRRGGDPLRLLLRNGFRLVAALLLILPGLLGDLAGLLLLLPPVQRRVAADLARRGMRPANLGRRPRGWADPRAARPPVAREVAPEVADAEWEELPPPGAPPRPGPRPGSRPNPRPSTRPPSGWTRH